MTANFSTIPIALQTANIPYPIRAVTQADLNALQTDCWAHRSPENNQNTLHIALRAIEKKRGLGIVVEASAIDKKIIAYGQYLCLTHYAEISDLTVSEQYRSQGIGTAMIQCLIASIRKTGHNLIEIGVAESNPRALALYEKIGFQISYNLNLNLGNGQGKVIYLRLKLPQKIALNTKDES